MKLNIYTQHWDNDGYGGGLIVIAAESVIDAQKIADENAWRNTEGDLPKQIAGASYEGKPCVLADGYYQE